MNVYKTGNPLMNSIAKIVSLIALVITLLPCVLYFRGVMDAPQMKSTMLVGTLLWFAVTPIWMGRQPEVDDLEVQV